ncbi:MAG: WD40/YVTN/BNR-like repeat-containing protein [Pseudomonas sp.]
MSEPVRQRIPHANSLKVLHTQAVRLRVSVAHLFRLCSALCLLTFAATLHAASPAANAGDYAIESSKAIESLLLDVTRAGTRLVAVGDRGHILFSDNNAKIWTQAKVPTKQMLTAVFFVDDKKGWAVGHDAQILASEDGGATWTQQYIDREREAGAPFLDVWFQDANTGFVVGAYNALFVTHDGGKHWEDISERLDNEFAYHLNGIVAVKDAGLFIVGELGSMFRSADGGQTWETLEGPYEGSLFGALATNQADTLLVYGLRGHLFRSTDFGASWEQIELNTSHNGPLEFGLADGTLLADGSMVVVGHGGSVLKSTDNGRSFSVFNRPDRLSLAGVSATDDGKLILVGQGGVHAASPTGADLGQP